MAIAAGARERRQGQRMRSSVQRVRSGVESRCRHAVRLATLDDTNVIGANGRRPTLNRQDNAEIQQLLRVTRSLDRTAAGAHQTTGEGKTRDVRDSVWTQLNVIPRLRGGAVFEMFRCFRKNHRKSNVTMVIFCLLSMS
jgi:hypothetical protein